MKTTEKNTAEIKSDLHKLIDFIEDFNLLKAIYLLLATNEKVKEKSDFWFELPDNLKIEIEEAIEEADSGKFIPHDEAMKQIKEKIQNIKCDDNQELQGKRTEYK
jgi:hypothetical protein